MDCARGRPGGPRRRGRRIPDATARFTPINAIGAPHCSHGSTSPWPSAASASKMTCASAFLRRAVSGGSARHSSGHAYQSRRTPSAVRQSSKLSGAASVDSAHWQRSQGSVGSKSDRSATIGCRTRTPADGTMSGRTAISSPSRSVPIARGRSTPRPPGSGAAGGSRPPASANTAGSATTGRSASLISTGVGSTRSSPLAARARPGAICSRTTPPVAGSRRCSPPRGRARPRA